MGGGSNNIKVCVRCRPFITREMGEVCAVTMPTKTNIIITESDGTTHPFTYDRTYWSHSQEDEQNGFATQQTLMDELGMELLDNAIGGYNDCLFAYGQTGAGKTWSVIGGKDMKTEGGLLPRMMDEIFRMISKKKEEDASYSFQTKVSYLEIYNEKVRDLLSPKKDKDNLDVRQHPKLGIYVPGLIEEPTDNYQGAMNLMDFGMANRAVAATSMNDRSSRSHCIFIFALKQIKGPEAKPILSLSSKINLVDLAGSERQKKTDATGDRLKEGAQINQSLTCLALVIHALAKAAKAKEKKGGKEEFVPFRNSKLTYLLQPSLVGNSKTVMIAAVSPATSNAEESISTLRFANSVKEIETKAVKNQESDQSVVNQLKMEIERMKAEAAAAIAAAGGGGPGWVPGSGGGAPLSGEQQEQLDMLHELVGKYGTNFKEEMEKAATLKAEREDFMDEMGLNANVLVSKMNLDPNTPYLVNQSDDPSLSGCLTYFIPENPENKILLGADKSCTITLKGLGINKIQCSLQNEGNTKVTVSPIPDEAGSYGRLCLNGRLMGKEPFVLKGKDRFMVGRSYTFKLVCPLQQASETAAAEQQAELIEGHLGEVMDTSSEEFQQAKVFVESVADKIGEDSAKTFLASFAQALPLVQEGNDITDELRFNDRLLMRLDVIYDILAYESAEPMLCVRLWKKEPPAAKLKRVFKKVLNRTQAKNNMFSVSSVLAGAGFGGQSSQDLFTDGIIENSRVQLLGVWSWRSFLVRLSGMREAYDEYSDTGTIPQFLSDLDPWAEISFLDVRQKVTIDSIKDAQIDTHSRSGAEKVIDALRLRVRLLEEELSAANAKNRENLNTEALEKVAAKEMTRKELENTMRTWYGTDKYESGSLESKALKLREAGELAGIFLSDMRQLRMQIQKGLST